MNPHLQRALSLLQRDKDPHAALVWLHRAVEEEPGNAAACAWLGQTLCHIGQRWQGLQHLAHAAQAMAADARPASLSQTLEVIAQLQRWGAPDLALPEVRGLAERLPAEGRVQQLLASLCGQLNHTTEALAAAERASALLAGDATIAVLQASLLADARRYDEARDLLEALIDRLSEQFATPARSNLLDARALFQSLKELARVLDAQDDREAVFSQLQAAAEVAPLLPEYARLDADEVPRSLAADTAEVQRLGMPCPPQPAMLPGHRDARAPAFILGFFRSGTTLIQQVLRAHPEVFLSDEVSLLRGLRQEVHRLRPGSENWVAKLASLDAAEVGQLRRAYWDAAVAYHGPECEKGVFVDKFALNTVDLPLIHAVFPDARILLAMRDPRDVCLSCIMQLMVAGPATIHLLRLESAVQLYSQVMTAWLQWAPRMKPAWLELRYESTVADLEGTFRPVLEFLGLQWRDELAEFHRSAAGLHVASPSRNQVAQPLYRTSVARWRRYETEMAPMLAALAPYIQAFGYQAE